LLSKNIQIKTYAATILLIILYGCETWPLTLRKEHNRLRMFENRKLRKTSGHKVEVTGSGEDYILRSFRICTPHQILFE
jgi:hypothetical protein